MEINDGRYVNFQSVGFSKKNIEKPVSSNGETKKAEANSMDALSASGRAFVNMSFKGNSVNSSSTEIKELTDEEFEELKKKLEEKLKTFPKNIRKEIEISGITKKSIFVINKILSDERLYSNKNFMDGVGWIIVGINTPEKAKVKMDVINKILSDERLYGNKSFMNEAGNIIINTNTSEEAQIKLDLMDKILSDKRLYGNEGFMKKAGNIIINAKTPEQVQITNKILSDERLYGNKSFMNKAGNIIINTNTPEEAQIKLDLMDKILSDKRLCDSENFMHETGEIIRYTDTPEQAQIANIILSDERLYGNKSFMNKAGNIIRYTDTPEKAQAKIDVMNKILSDERLYGNESFMNETGDIIINTSIPEKAQAKIDVMDKILSDERLCDNESFMNEAGDIIYHTDTPDGAQAKIDVMNKILSDERLYGNESFMNKAGNIIINTNTSEEAQIKLDLMDKILSDERLYSNESFMSEVGEIICWTNTPEEAQAKIDVMNKVLSDERLYGNENVMNKAGEIIRHTDTPEEAQIANKILSDERLYGNESFMNKAVWIINSTERAQIKSDVINKILSDERLYINENFMNGAAWIIITANSPERAQIKLDVINKILSDERLYGNDSVMNKAGEIIRWTNTPEKAQIANKILSDERLYGNKSFINRAGEIINYTDTPEEAQIKLDLMDKILSDEKLYSNESFMNKAVDIIISTNTPEKVEIANKILSDEKLYSNESFMNKAGEIISSIDAFAEVNSRIGLINKVLSDEKLYGNEGVMENITNIMKHDISFHKIQDTVDTIDKILSDERLANNKFIVKSFMDIEYLLNKVQVNKNVLFKKLHILSDFNLDKIFNSNNTDGNNIFIPLVNMQEEDLQNLDKLSDKVEKQREVVLHRAELYVNGEYENKDELFNEVNNFFDKNKAGLIFLSSIFDKETINNILRMRFDDAEEYMHLLNNLNNKDIELLKGLASEKSCNIDNKPLMPSQKAQFLYLVLGYKKNKIDTTAMQNMINNGIIDTAKLNFDLFKGILQKCGFSDEEISQIPADKLTGWDVEYIHLLSNEINKKPNVFRDLLIASNLYDFKDYIQDESNIYGKANAKTKEIFKNYGMNYDAWINQPENNSLRFITKDKSGEQLKQISSQIEEDIEALRKTPVKGFIDKQFKQYIQDDKFIIPDEIKKSKSELEKLTQNIFKQLEGAFKRAEGNLNNPQRAKTAQNTLTIKSHLEQRLDDISKVKNSKAEKNLDLTIKMWDRYPQKDIFQGNYSTCCIGMNGGNGSAMPHYLLNTAYNMIELVDNNSGKIIGNALCYFITDKDNKPAFVIDNIEIKNSKKPSDSVGIELRNKMAEYAKTIAENVTGNSNTKIYMSSQYNDVPCNDLKAEEQEINFLGDIDCDEIYMDLYGNWTDKEDFSGTVKTLELA